MGNLFALSSFEKYLAIQPSRSLVTNLAAGIDKEATKRCAQSLEQELQNFTLPVDVIGAAIGALAVFVQEASSSDSTVIDADQRQPLVRALFNVGELSMAGVRVSRRREAGCGDDTPERRFQRRPPPFERATCYGILFAGWNERSPYQHFE
jgi:hypothetical protein